MHLMFGALSLKHCSTSFSHLFLALYTSSVLLHVHFITSDYLSLQSNSALRVGDLDTDLLGLSNNVNSVLGRHVVGNLSSVGLGVHQQHVQVTDVSDDMDLVAGGDHVLGGLVGTITDVGLRDGASESSSDTRVDTLLLSPVLSDTVVSVRVVSLELLGVLLDNLGVGKRSSHCLLVLKEGTEGVCGNVC